MASQAFGGRGLYAKEEFGIELDKTVYALDSKTIDLCLSLFTWAKFRKYKAGVKLHTLLDLRGNIPTFIRITKALLHDVNILDDIIPEAGTFYIMYLAYLDFARLYILHQCLSFFITRAKGNFRFRRLYSHPIDKSTGLRCDQKIVLTGFYSSEDYPEKFRCICYVDKETEQDLVFLTNCFTLPAITIAQLYKYRWQVGLFFKWTKQHLRIKTFFGTSENAVKTQIMDRNIGLRTGSNNQKATESGLESLHNYTDLERDLVRESVYFSSTYGSWLQN